MNEKLEKRSPEGLFDYVAISLTTFGVGYMPIAPGTFGSMVGIVIYLGVVWFDASAELYLAGHGWNSAQVASMVHAVAAVAFLLFSLVGVWAAGRSVAFFGNKDPSQAVIDEVMGQLIVFLFVPFGLHWGYVLAGFLLFRLFDIWKPYPIDDLQNLPAGIGICADDLLAGVYAGVCLAIAFAVNMSL